MYHLLRNIKKWAYRFILTQPERRHLLVGHPKHWQLKRDFQIKFLKGVGLKPQHFLFDIGCGTLRGGIPIIEYLEVGHYTGVESRHNVYLEAQKELAEAKLAWKEPELINHLDISTLQLERQFEFIWAFSVLFHMSDKIVLDTLELVKSSLSDDGVFYANVNIGERKKGDWQEFPVIWRPMAFYQNACHQLGLAISDIGPLKELGHNSRVQSQDEQRMLKIWKAKES